MLGGQRVRFAIAGVEAGTSTAGHRFLGKSRIPVKGLAVALHLDPPFRGSVALGQRAANFVECPYWRAVDRHHTVAGLHPGDGGGPLGQHLHAGGGQIGKAVCRVQRRDQKEGEHVIHARAGRDDKEPAPRGLVGVGPLVGRVLRGGIVGCEAGDAAVAAQRKRTQAIVGVAVAKAGDARAEPERKDLYPHPEQTGEREVTRFVYGDEDAQPDGGQQDGNHGRAV